ncbi:hypothetical protein DXG03_001227 [Asterophora parasitica]|uniref:Ankyrin repeat protein n=1 Tax=Asterophora parasitica TaxID=117018 RepID=A0A9P7G9S1_9AGAR|nr:hypothetical protein DXG03_001227 [Asterophora parasitica]
MADEITKGASNNERLLAAARSDNEDLLLEVFEEGNFDVNCVDGVSNGSTDVLEHILSHEECDVDPQNRLDKSTPLHLAVKIEHVALRRHVVDSLLEAGADTRIKDKHNQTAVDLLPPEETEIRGLIRKAQAQESVARDDIASEGEEDGSAGSGSDSDE